MSAEKDNTSKGFKSLTFDIEYYQSFLDDPELSEDQKREFLETMWSIIVQCVDWGYGIHPVQQTQAGLLSSPTFIAGLFADCAAGNDHDGKHKTPPDKEQQNTTPNEEIALEGAEQ